MMQLQSIEVVPVTDRHKLKEDEALKKQGALKIMKAFKRHKIVKGLKWRKSIKQIIMAVVNAWRTRRALNCLGAEV